MATFNDTPTTTAEVTSELRSNASGCPSAIGDNPWYRGRTTSPAE
jgi:hypothetical protein